MVRVQVPATVANLGPGFDCLGLALQLYNTVEMAVAAGVSVEVQGEGAAEIARNEGNLVYRAAMRLFRQTENIPGGLKIKLINSIPLAKGLGSSAAAVVGGLVAANVLSGRKFSAKELLTMAAAIEGHPDNVAPALLGGLVVSVAAEGEIKCVKLDVPSELKAVLVVPDFSVFTKAARDVLPPLVSLQDAAFNLGRLALLVAAFSRGDLSLLPTAMEDRLHQSYRASLVPGMKKVLAAARLAGARGVCLSGTGPSLLAFADGNFEFVARVMKDTFAQNGVRSRTMVLEISPVGARALKRV